MAKGLFGLARTMAVMMASSHAWAQQPIAPEPVETAGNGEIVVTAQRRSQTLQEVPLAVGALDSATLKTINANDITSLTAAAPGISGVAQGLLQPVISIRGISSNSFGIGGEASVGVFIDDAYIGRLSGSSVPFLDVERVEVLRGPQGSLYGRNSTAGAISIITRKPDFNGYSLELAGSYGRFDSYDASVIGNAPLGDRSAIRIALQVRGDSGYDRNVVTGSRAQGSELYGGRVSFRSDLTDSLSLNASLAYSRERAGAFPFKTIEPALALRSGTDVDPFSGRFAQEVDGKETRDTFGGNLTLRLEASDALSLQSTTTFNRSKVEGIYDVDGSALPILRTSFSDGVSQTIGQEFRATYSRGPLVVQFGANAFFERIRDQRALRFDERLILPTIGTLVFGTADGRVPADAIAPGSPAFAFCDPVSAVVLGVACAPLQSETIRQRGRYASYAVFADAELRLSDTLTATVSGRYSIDTKRFSFAAPLVVSQGSIVLGTNVLLSGDTAGTDLRRTWRDFQPRFVLRWMPNRDLNIYASATRGYKSGGFDPAADAVNFSANLSQFDAEAVWSYELGLKADLADRRIGLNVSAYRFNYTGFQTQILRNGITSTLNVPRYNGLGVEADVTIRPTRFINLGLGGSWNDATFGSFVVDDRTNTAGTLDLRGNRSPVAPEWSGFARADVAVPVTGALNLRGTVNATWRSEQFFSIYSDPRERQGAYALVDASLWLERPSSRWSVGIVGQNLFDKNYLTVALDQGYGVVTARGRPRTLAIEGRVRF